MQPREGFLFKVVKWETCKGQRLLRVYQSGSWVLYLASRGIDSGEKGREGLTEERKEWEVLGLGHVPRWASMVHLSCLYTWNYGLMGFSAPWPPHLSGVLWEMWGQPSALQQGNLPLAQGHGTALAALCSDEPKTGLNGPAYELSWKPIMCIMVMHDVQVDESTEPKD